MFCSRGKCFLQSSSSSSEIRHPRDHSATATQDPRLCHSWSVATKQPRVEPAYNKIRGVIQQRVYTRFASMIWTNLNCDRLKSGADCIKTVLIQLLASGASDRDVRARGRHFEHLLQIYRKWSDKTENCHLSVDYVFVVVRLIKWCKNGSTLHFLIVSQDSVETEVRWGRKWKHRFMPTSFRNTFAKNIKIGQYLTKL